jgi:hydrogenase maturation protease
MPKARSLRSEFDRAPPRILVFGYGNPGRQDDGAGVVFVEELAAWAQLNTQPWLAFDTNYQLNVEDALTVAQHDVVVFADAAKDQAEGYRFRAIHPVAGVSFSTHAMSPESVLALSRELYGASPAAFLLTFKGHAWEPNGFLTPETRHNLDAAKPFMTRILDNRGAELIQRDFHLLSATK